MLWPICINYTGDGVYATYDNGTPVSMIMTLNFQELTPVYAEDYENTEGEILNGFFRELTNLLYQSPLSRTSADEYVEVKSVSSLNCVRTYRIHLLYLISMRLHKVQDQTQWQMKSMAT